MTNVLRLAIQRHVLHEPPDCDCPAAVVVATLACQDVAEALARFLQEMER